MRIGFAVGMAGIAAGLVPLTSVASGANEVHVLSAVGMRQVMVKLGPEFEAATGHRLAISFDSGAVILKRLASGETADVVLIPRSAVEQLLQAGRVATGPLDLAMSGVGVAVRRGAPKPDISSPAAFRRAMLEAKTIACPDPALGGSGGVHIARVFERLGISRVVKGKLVLSSSPGDEAAMPGSLVARGKAQMAVHQIQETAGGSGR